MGNKMYVRSAGSWVETTAGSAVTTSASIPSSPVTGQTYFNTTEDVLYVYDGSAWYPAANKDLNIEQRTSSQVLALADKNLLIEMNVATGNTVSIPTDASVSFPIGTQINISQLGIGQTTIQAVTSGTTTVVGSPGLKLRAQYSFVTCIKRAANFWIVVGDTAA